jgi:hypothetical protein
MCDEGREYNIADFYKLKRPCANCPFLKEGAIELRPGRVEGILDGLMQDDHAYFMCHKTLDGCEDEEGEYAATGNEKMCAGAAAVLWKRHNPSIGMRIAIATGIAEPELWENNADIVID